LQKRFGKRRFFGRRAAVLDFDGERFKSRCEMPTYEYVCTSCGNQWEEIQKISEPSLTDCPKCKNASAKRQISGGNFILKGGGWYADLYSSSGGKKSESSSSGGESKPEAKSESKSESSGGSESKSDTKPAPAPAATPAKPST